MSTTAKPKVTLTEAAKHAALVLELQDTKRLQTALAYAASEEIEHNANFAARVVTLYNVLPPSASSGGGRRGGVGAKAAPVELVPLKYTDSVGVDLAAPLDPYFLYDVYGEHQLPIALNLFSAGRLKEAAALVQERNPGTKPTHRSHKDALVEYIIRYVVE
jgi:hypothetical protein